jgi:hypothetical protein
VHISIFSLHAGDYLGEKGEAYKAACRAFAATLVPLIDSGDLIWDGGMNKKSWHGMFAIESLAFVLRKGFGTIEAHFKGPFSGLPRRLTLLLYNTLLEEFDAQQQGTFQREGVKKVCLR